MENNIQDNKSNSLLELFLTFFKIGAFTFGGGLAMISLMQEETVTKHKWVTEKEMLDMIVIAESTPGVYAVNTATYVGYKVKKFWGSLIATIAVVLPSFITIMIVSLLLEQFKSNVIVNSFLLGIKAGVVILIIKAVFKFFKAADPTAFTIILAFISFIVSLLFDVPVLICLGVGALLGLIKGFLFNKKEVTK